MACGGGKRSKDAIIFERGVKSRFRALPCHFFLVFFASSLFISLYHGRSVMLVAVAVDFGNIV